MPEGVVAAPRRAEVADLPALARKLARAFVDDPGAVWGDSAGRVESSKDENLASCARRG